MEVLDEIEKKKEELKKLKREAEEAKKTEIEKRKNERILRKKRIEETTKKLETIKNMIYKWKGLGVKEKGKQNILDEINKVIYGDTGSGTNTFTGESKEKVE